MGRRTTIRTYMSVNMPEAKRQRPEFWRACLAGDEKTVVQSIDENLWDYITRGHIDLRMPSFRFCPLCAAGEAKEKGPSVETLSHVNIACAYPDADALLGMHEILRSHQDFIDVGADLAFDAVDHWCPDAGRQFADRTAANRLIGLQALKDEKLSGEGVHVIIVDRGLNAEDIKQRLNGRFGGGWAIIPRTGGARIEPGTLEVVRGITNNDHGMMIARNILAVAPDVCLYDLPLIPPRIVGIPTFLSDAQAALEQVLADLRLRQIKENGERWIVVNAWAPFDRMSEIPRGSYSANPHHPFLKLIDEMVNEKIDIVFAAGNCGQFCPDPRCGPYDVGPGRSIYGANAHPRVLTVGAITTHPIAIGSSSQGEGQRALAGEKPDFLDLAREKPDLVAPSMFSEDRDRHTRNGGTSAACAMAAGVLAALRQQWGPKEVSPEAMMQCLRDTARRPGRRRWDARLGWGVINAEAALRHLAQESGATRHASSAVTV